MSRNRSVRAKKLRHSRAKSERRSTKSAKPGSPAPAPGSEPAKPAVDSTSPPTKTPKPVTSLSLVRRAAHQDRKLKARVRLLEKQVAHFRECEKHLARVLEQLAAARTQIGELNSAMHYLLSKPPHNGRYHDKASGLLCRCLAGGIFSGRVMLILSALTQNYGTSEKWGRSMWECPVRWNQHD